MNTQFRERPGKEPIVFVGSGDHQIHTGDWVYLKTGAEETLCVEVEHTDHESAGSRFEGRIHHFEPELGVAPRSLAHLDLAVDQSVVFEEQHIFSCSHHPDKDRRTRSKTGGRHIL